MASLNEISYNILNLLRGGRSSHNDYYDLDQIKFNIKYYRNLFLRRDLQRNTRLQPFEQELKILTCSPVTSDIKKINGSKLLKSNEQIPRLLRSKHRNSITYVGPLNNSTSYDIVNSNEARYQSYNKYTGSKSRSFESNQFIYLTGKIANNVVQSKFIDSTDIRVRGIFEDPEKVIEFNTGDYYDHDKEFPSLPDDYIQRITQGLISGELNLMVQTQSDLQHNNRDDKVNVTN